MVGKTETSASSTRADDVGRKSRNTAPRYAYDDDKPVRQYRKSPARQDVNKKSPKRAKSPGRPKSPARTHSPTTTRARSPGRPKSPARSVKKEETSSPGRGRPALSSRSSTKEKKSPARKVDSDKKKATKSSVIDLDSDSDNYSETMSEKSKSSTTVSNLRKSQDILENESLLIRRSARIRGVERVVHLKTSYEPIAKLTEFSDSDDFELLKKSEEIIETTKPNQIKESKDFGGLFSALIFMVTMPVFLFGMLAICNDKQCSFKIPDLSPYKLINTYFDLSVFFTYTAYILFIAILSAIPFGGRKTTGMLNKSGKLDYVMNGLLSALIVLILFAGLEAYNIRVSTYIHDKYFQLASSSFILAIALSLVLYFKSLYVPISHLNPNGSTNSKVYNFSVGNEVNPRIFGVLDIKLFLFRTCMISLLVLTSSCIYESLGLTTGPITATMKPKPLIDFQSLNINATLLTICSLMIIYALDVLIFEYTLVSTYEVQHEGVGFSKCVECLSFIYLFTLIPKYVYDFNVQLPTWQLIGSVLVFLVGYFLYRGSNSQKYAFRQNPYSPALAHLESIPTSAGKKLICSSFWGFVRHPNYLGDMLINLSYLPFVVYNPPCIIIYLSLLYLIQRANIDNKRCKQHYGTAWERYCLKVQYILIPKIY